MIDKIKQLMESLISEFENLRAMMVTIDSEAKRLKEKEIELSAKELSLSSRESKSITQVKTNDETGKELSRLQADITAKQGKLQEEWDRMLKEKEEWTGTREEMVKERLRLENLSKELDEAKEALSDEDKVVKKKQESTQELSKMLILKEKKLKREKAKVSKYLSQF